MSIVFPVEYNQIRWNRRYSLKQLRPLAGVRPYGGFALDVFEADILKNPVTFLKTVILSNAEIRS